MSTIIKFPFGDADSQTPAYAAIIAATINNSYTYIEPGALTGDLTLNLSVNTEMIVGAEILMRFTASGGDRTVTFGTGFTGVPNLVIPTGETRTVVGFYTGSTFIEKAEPTGIDSAAVALNTTHRTGNGSDHANVATNTTGVATNVTAIANIINGTTPFTGEVETTANIGTIPGAGVTVVEAGGDGIHHRTTLTITALDLGAVTGGVDQALGVLIYTLPAGAIVNNIAYMSIALAGDAAIQADAPDVGIGTTVGAGAQALLSGVGAAAENVLTGQTAADTNGTATLAMVSDQILNVAAAGDHTVYLNAADGWAAGGSAALLATGTVVIDWTLIA